MDFDPNTEFGRFEDIVDIERLSPTVFHGFLAGLFVEVQVDESGHPTNVDIYGPKHGFSQPVDGCTYNIERE